LQNFLEGAGVEEYSYPDCLQLSCTNYHYIIATTHLEEDEYSNITKSIRVIKANIAGI
jgi:hypothetical protein